MPIPFGFQRIPRCLSCLRRLGRGAETYGFDFQASRQIRGLKKSAKAPPTVKVKLLKDVKRYGRQGEYFRVASMYTIDYSSVNLQVTSFLSRRVECVTCGIPDAWLCI